MVSSIETRLISLSGVPATWCRTSFSDSLSHFSRLSIYSFESLIIVISVVVVISIGIQDPDYSSEVVPIWLNLSSFPSTSQQSLDISSALS